MSRLPLVLTLTVLAAVPAASLDLNHVPITNAPEGSLVRIEATFSGTETVTAAHLFFRKSAGAFVPQPMAVSGNQLGGELPADVVAAPAVEYYLEVQTSEGGSVTFPPQNAESAPLRIAVLASGGRFESRAVFPEPGSEVDDPRPEIRVAFTRGQGGLDPASVRVFLDGLDVSGEAQVGEDQLTLTPPEPLAPGLHRLNILARSRSGGWAPSLALSFRVMAPRKGWPLSLHGTLALESSFVAVHDEPADIRALSIPRTASGFGPVARLDASGTFGSDRVRLKAVTNPVDRGEQPAPDSYLAELKGDSHRLAVGDTTVQFGEFAARYLRLRGGDGELKVGPMKLRAFGGRSKRAIERPQFLTGTFERTVAGGRAGLSLGKAELGGQYVTGGDDVSSLPSNYRTTPSMGSAAVLDASLPLAWGLSLEGEAGKSRFERDRRTGVERKGSAWRAKLRGLHGRATWSLGYKQVDPDFTSIANPFVQGDTRGFEGDARFPLGAASLTATGASHRDNLEGRKSGTLRTRRAGATASIPPKPGRPGFTLGGQYSAQATDPGALFEIRTRTLGVNAGVQFAREQASLGFNAGTSAFRDLSSTALAGDNDSYNGSVNASWREPKWWTNASGGATFFKLRNTGDTSRFFFANAGTGLQWTRDLSSQFRLNANRGLSSSGSLDSLEWGYAAELSWTVRPFTLKASAEGVRSTDRLTPADSFSETEFTLGLQYAF